jgi:hypothetical protein
MPNDDQRVLRALERIRGQAQAQMADPTAVTSVGPPITGFPGWLGAAVSVGGLASEHQEPGRSELRGGFTIRYGACLRTAVHALIGETAAEGLGDKLNKLEETAATQAWEPEGDGRHKLALSMDALGLAVRLWGERPDDPPVGKLLQTVMVALGNAAAAAALAQPD